LWLPKKKPRAKLLTLAAIPARTFPRFRRAISNASRFQLDGTGHIALDRPA
jgi:hypothetical protein